MQGTSRRKDLSIGILGGGVLGLSAAHSCLARGLGSVTIYEGDEEPGGLARTFEVCGTRRERYHHFVCSIDRVIMEQMREFGLGHLIEWNQCRTGIFVAGRAYDLTTPGDLLCFDAIDLLSRLRLGAATFCLKRMRRWEPLERISAARWLRRWAGRRCYDVVWSHLMRSKFDGFEDQIPLSWLWARATRRIGSKKKGSNLDHFGYVRGSVAVLVDEYVKRIGEMGADLRTTCGVRRVSRTGDGEFIIRSDSTEQNHRAIISTVPLPSLLYVADFFSDDYRAKLASVQYQTVLNMALVLKRSLSRFFWLNIGDKSLPVPGIIEFSKLRPTCEFNGRTIVYLPNYLPEEHRLNQLSNEALLDEYLQALCRMFPDFERDWVEEWHVFRYPHADPYYTLNYSKLLPKHRTPFEGLYIFNTAQIYPITRNVSNSILFGHNAAKMLEEDLGAR